MLAGSLGLLVGGIGSAFLGAQLGWQEMFISLLPSIGIIVGASALNIANPLFLIPILLGAAGVQGFIKTHMATEKIKMKIAEECSNEMNKNVWQMAQEASKKIRKEIDAIFAYPIIQSLDQEIQAIKDQLQYTIAEKEKGESSTKQKQQELDVIKNKLMAIKQDMEECLCLLFSQKSS